MPFAPFISAISLAVLVFLTVVLAIDRRRPRGTGYLIALLLILGLTILLRLCFDLGSPLLVYLPFVVFPATFLYGPCIYLYAESVLFEHRISHKLLISMLAVTAIALGLHAILHFYYAEMRDAKTIILQSGMILSYSRTLVLAGTGYALIFIAIAWRSVRRYEKACAENFAGSERDQIQWLKTFVILNLFLVGSFAAAICVSAILDLKIPATPFEGIVALFMIYVILYYFIRKPLVFAIADDLATVTAPDIPQKYQKQKLSDIERKTYILKIEEYLRNEKPFLDDKVTLASLAKELAIPAHHFSMVINIERNTNFYNFINAYRVEEAKALLKNPEMADETILDIALMAGFQSKAGFNKVFKAVTGQTPSEFRQKVGI